MRDVIQEEKINLLSSSQEDSKKSMSQNPYDAHMWALASCFTTTCGSMVMGASAASASCGHLLFWLCGVAPLVSSLITGGLAIQGCRENNRAKNCFNFWEKLSDSEKENTIVTQQPTGLAK